MRRLSLGFIVLAILLGFTLVDSAFIKTTGAQYGFLKFQQNIYVRPSACNDKPDIGTTGTTQAYKKLNGSPIRGCGIDWCKIDYGGRDGYVACFYSFLVADPNQGISTYPQDCMFSSWKCGGCFCSGSNPTRTCSRNIDTNASNGGKPCAGPTSKTERCSRECPTGSSSSGSFTGGTPGAVVVERWEPTVWQATRQRGTDQGYCRGEYCGQCTYFVQAVTGASYGGWRKGANVWHTKTAKKGDAIATFFGAGNTYQGHVAIFDSYLDNGIMVYDQNWAGAKYVTYHRIRLGGGTTVNHAESYHIMMRT